MIVAFIEQMRAEGHAVESICRVLCEQGCQVAARTYRAWAQPGQQVAPRTLSDALVEDKVRELGWTIDDHGRRRLTPVPVAHGDLAARPRRNAATSKETDLVMAPLRMAIWQRDRDGHPIVPGQLIGRGCRVAIHIDPLHRAPRPRRRSPSIGSVGDAYDNALMESVVGPTGLGPRV